MPIWNVYLPIFAYFTISEEFILLLFCIFLHISSFIILVFPVLFITVLKGDGYAGRCSFELVHFIVLVTAITLSLSKLILMKRTFDKVEIALIKFVGGKMYLRSFHSCMTGLFLPTPLAASSPAPNNLVHNDNIVKGFNSFSS